jgi:type II secretory pathway component PulF
MTYKVNRPPMKRHDPEEWTTKLSDWFKSTFWLLFLIAVFGALIYLAYQAVMTEIHASKPGTKIGAPN